MSRKNVKLYVCGDVYVCTLTLRSMSLRGRDVHETGPNLRCPVETKTSSPTLCHRGRSKTRHTFAKVGRSVISFTKLYDYINILELYLIILKEGLFV